MCIILEKIVVTKLVKRWTLKNNSWEKEQYELYLKNNIRKFRLLSVIVQNCVKHPRSKADIFLKEVNGFTFIDYSLG